MGYLWQKFNGTWVETNMSYNEKLLTKIPQSVFTQRAQRMQRSKA